MNARTVTPVPLTTLAMRFTTAGGTFSELAMPKGVAARRDDGQRVKAPATSARGG
jgi:hypothetical protein